LNLYNKHVSLEMTKRINFEWNVCICGNFGTFTFYSLVLGEGVGGGLGRGVKCLKCIISLYCRLLERVGQCAVEFLFCGVCVRERERKRDCWPLQFPIFTIDPLISQKVF
jgi:hypothetical protein